MSGEVSVSVSVSVSKCERVIRVVYLIRLSSATPETPEVRVLTKKVSRE